MMNLKNSKNLRRYNMFSSIYLYFVFVLSSYQEEYDVPQPQVLEKLEYSVNMVSLVAHNTCKL